MIVDFFRGVDKWVAEAPASLIILIGVVLAFGLMALLVLVTLLVGQ